MLQISIPWMIDVAASLDALDAVTKESKVGEIYFELFEAQHQLDQLFNQSIYRPYLRSSRQRATDLHGALDRVMTREDDKWDEPIAHEAFSIKTARDNFKLVFLSEISTLPVFLVSMKPPYDMNSLITAGVELFPSAMLAKAPEANFDAMEAGKALAYSLGTACGFHVIRVTECILRRYWDSVAAGKPRPKLETIGTFVHELDAAKLGDKKVLESLKQFNKLHRNPCIHPGVILSDEEAIGIIGMARSVIAAMLAVMPDVPPTTSSVSPQP